MEFVTFEEAWSLLRRLGVTKVTDAPKEMRFELADSPSVVVIDVAADDHPEIKSLPHEVRRVARNTIANFVEALVCLLYTSPSPRDRTRSRMPSSA